MHIDIRWCELGASAHASKLTYMHVHACTYFLSYTNIYLQTYIICIYTYTHTDAGWCELGAESQCGRGKCVAGGEGGAHGGEVGERGDGGGEEGGEDAMRGGGGGRGGGEGGKGWWGGGGGGGGGRGVAPILHTGNNTFSLCARG